MPSPVVFHDPAAMQRNGRIDQLAAELAQALNRSFLIQAGQPGIARDIGGQDRGELARRVHFIGLAYPAVDPGAWEMGAKLPKQARPHASKQRPRSSPFVQEPGKCAERAERRRVATIILPRGVGGIVPQVPLAQFLAFTRRTTPLKIAERNGPSDRAGIEAKRGHTARQQIGFGEECRRVVGRRTTDPVSPPFQNGGGQPIECISSRGGQHGTLLSFLVSRKDRLTH
jgi:hypothetical protein